MQFLCTCHDEQIDKPYDLYLINARDIHKLLKDTYNRKLTDLQIQLFNTDVGFYRLVSSLKKARELKSIDKLSLEEELLAIKERFLNNTFISETIQLTSEWAFENLPLIVSVKDRNITGDNPTVELLDGFRRMFYTRTVPNRNILVKVYGTLDDTEWINSMLVFNSWKFAESTWSKFYMDRGFRLGLYYRFRLDFTEFFISNPDGIFQAIDIFASSDPHKTFWNNDLAHQDFKSIYHAMSFQPNGVEYEEEGMVSPGYLLKVLECFVWAFGEVRRSECLNELKVRDKVIRKVFKPWIVEDYFLDNSALSHLHKISTIKIPELIDTYIENFMKDDIMDWTRDKYQSVLRIKPFGIGIE